jgi:zinc protease
LGQSPGGTSLAPDSLFLQGEFAASLVNQGGLGKFGPTELRKKLQDKVVRISPDINSLSEGIRGSSTPQDLETMFQLIYLYFVQPRVDSTAFISYKTRLQDLLKNRALNPEAVFADTVNLTMSQNHFRERPLNEQMLEELDLNRAFAFYKDRFAEAGDFTFYIVGNFEIDEIKPLVLSYLGSLPTIHRKETWHDIGLRAPTGVIEKKVYRGIEPKSEVEIIFTGPFDWSQLNRRKLYAMTDVLSLKLREVIREDLGGTYTISATSGTSHFPLAEYEVSITFNCDPERSGELIQTIFQQIDSLQNFGTTEKYLTKVREKGIRDFEENIKRNTYWLSLLSFYDLHGEDPNSIIRGPEEFLNQLDSSMIQNAAIKYLNRDNFATFILLPEKMKN